MPGLSLVVHESSNLGGNYNHSRSIDQMCRQDSRVRLSAEEAVVAEESISVYCKPVELYNILQHRALRNPSFLQRCLDYRIQTKHKRRIQMTLSLPKTMNNGEQMPGMLPLYILLVRPISDITVEKHSTGYSLCRAHILTAFSEDGRKDQTEASFILPEMKFPTEGKASNLTILLISYGEARNCPGENDLPIHSASFPSKFEGHCLWGRLQMESLYSIWKKSAGFSLGNRAVTLCTVDMLSNFLKPDSLNEGNRIVFQSPHNLETMGSRHVQINVSAQEIGARGRSPHDSYTYDDVPTSLLSHMRLRTGAVVFSYSYFNNILHKTEVTEDFSCPFCLVRCGSFKGLRHHLSCSHDLFNFDFWVTEEYQAVNVSVKTDICSREIVGNRVDPKLQTVSFCSKPRRRRRSKNLLQDTNHVYPHILKLDSPEEIREGSQEASFEKDAGAQIVTSPKQAEPLNGISLKRSGEAIASSKGEKTLKNSSCDAHLQYEWNKSSNCVQQCTEPVSSSMDITGACGVSAQSFTSNDCVQLASGNSTLLQFAKSRKLSADPRNVLVQRRTFFHSHRAQPMVLDQVLSDRDSEDEVDDCIADFEDRRMLDDFVDVSKDEKQIMHLWNSFVRKQRVLADGHVPWACEAFSRLHGRDLVQVPELIWCWRLFMIKLWNHSLLDARAINNCNLILDGYQKEASDLKIS